jgi:aerobic-type carbon monoxide dehydrogenase small subunit (CoxS/CutS family)
MKIAIELDVNGQAYEAEVAPAASLLDLLRDDFGLTGTKTNCLEAECGVCSVLVDGKVVNSCTMLAAQCKGRSVITIEGLARGDVLHPLQRAFIAHGAVQCGYCIPGMIINAKAMLAENPEPTRNEIREALAGTLCRCTGYQKILDAVEAVARGEFGVQAA